MMLPRLSLLLFGASLAALMLPGSAAERQNMLQRAKRNIEHRAASQVSPRPREKRGHEEFRYLTNSTKKYQVEELPHINYDVGEMYSGTIAVDSDDPSRSMFYVFQPKLGEPVDEVTIWFNGGPGCSSLEAFLQENGRFIWSWGMYSAVENPYSWVNLTNVLWVEYPIGVGFSQGDVTASSEEETAQDFLGFFRNFQDIFGIKNYKIYITGESYAGRYVPYVASAMLAADGNDHFDVAGALMYDPVISQYEYVGQTVPTVPFVKKNAEFFTFNDTYLAQLEEAHESCGYANFTNYFMQFPPPGPQPAKYDAYEKIGGNNSINCDVWTSVYTEAYRTNPCFNVYQIASTCPVLSDPLAYPSDLQYQYPGMGGIYFDRREVKEAMHAPLNVSWGECSGPVFVGEGGQYGVGDLSEDPIQKVLPEVIEATQRVLIANGDYDLEIITGGTLLGIQNMTWGGLLGFQEEPTTPIDIKLPDLQYQAVFEDSGLGGLDGPGQGIMGIQHQERGLLWAETFASGHMQPQFQPRSAYRHLQWVLGHIDEL